MLVNVVHGMEKFIKFYGAIILKELVEIEEMKKPELEEWRVESFVAQVCDG
jgi:hypothetical protein